MRTVLVARLDSLGDVVLSGPAVRAVAASADEVVYLCSPIGRPAAELLPGVSRLLTFAAPWVLADPPPLEPARIEQLIAAVRAEGIDEAVILTSFHQSPLPLALVLRMAGVGRIAAISEDYPGSLLDVRHQVPDGLHEVERACSLAAAAGYPLPLGDDRRLRLDLPEPRDTERRGGYVVVHPGAAAPARTWDPGRFASVVRALHARGHTVVVTGSAGEAALTGAVAGGLPGVHDAAGRHDLVGLARVLRCAAAVVTGNTGPAHVAAAVGTPVVSLFPPTVPAERWRPWGVPHVLLGDQTVSCAGCRALTCPMPRQHCLDDVTVTEVVEAVEHLAPAVEPVHAGVS
jgi:ADP-heptose:LPS heptosyltransferase